MTHIPDNPWIARLPHAGRPRIRLFCFPYAGGSAAIYRRWNTLLPPDIEVCLIRLPGRERRILEQPITDIAVVANAIANAMAHDADLPFVLFGHSMGAGIAYETALALARRNCTPLCLMPSARRAPHLPSRYPAKHLLSDDQFIDELKLMNGTPAAVLDNPELMALMLPVLRADFQLSDLYVVDRPVRLSCPIVAFGGDQDHYVTSAELDAWREVSNGSFTFHELQGDHFFINSHQQELTALVAREIASLQA